MVKLSNLSKVQLKLAYNSLLRLKESLADDESAEADPHEGPVSVELQQAHNLLLKLKRSIADIETEVDTNEGPVWLDWKLDFILSLLGSELEGPESTSDGMTMAQLATMNITFKGFLVLKDGFRERVATTISCGQNDLWSSPNLHRQLIMLEHILPVEDTSGTGLWINAFLSRASAMLPENKCMVLNIESETSFSGYTVVIANKKMAGFLRMYPTLDKLDRYRATAFFVAETRLRNINGHIEQAVCELYTCGKQLQTRFLRGAVTNGKNWIFLLTFDDDYEGASYEESEMVRFRMSRSLTGEAEIIGIEQDLIAAILSYWIENNVSDLGPDDWFERVGSRT